jgi:hypothetical protein
MARRALFAALLLAGSVVLAAGGCGGDDASHYGCSGTAVVVTATIVVDAGTGIDASADGGTDARPACTGTCRDYLEALRVGIEAATAATCMRLASGAAVLGCVPSSRSWCADDTADASGALEAQIRDYLAASWPEIDGSAVSVKTCLCQAN